MILLLYDDMTQVTDEAVAQMLPLVAPWRREEALAYQPLLARFCCLKSFLMLCDALRQMGVAVDSQTLHWERTAHGKPFLVSYPGVYFNISHCKRAIAVMVGHEPVGVDVEHFRTLRDDLVTYTMNAQEQQMVHESECPMQEFARLWTRKEAYLKWRGSGLVDALPEVLDEAPLDRLHSRLFAERGYALSWIEGEM